MLHMKESCVLLQVYLFCCVAQGLVDFEKENLYVLLTVDVLARTSMKNAANCDT